MNQRSISYAYDPDLISEKEEHHNVTLAVGPAEATFNEMLSKDIKRSRRLKKRSLSTDRLHIAENTLWFREYLSKN